MPSDEPPDDGVLRFAQTPEEWEAVFKIRKAADIKRAFAMLPTVKDYQHHPRPLVGGFVGDSTDDPHEDASDVNGFDLDDPDEDGSDNGDNS